MTLKSGILDFENCRIYAISEQDSSIIKSDDDSEINISNSLIRTTIPLYEGKDGKTIIDDSQIYIQNRQFLKCKTINIKDSIVKYQILLNTDEYKKLEAERAVDKIFSDNTSFTFFESNKGTIKIENSAFKGLYKLFSYQSRFDYIEIENSVFDKYCNLGDLSCSDDKGIIKNTIINQISDELKIRNFNIKDSEIKNSENEKINISYSKINDLIINKIRNITFDFCSFENLKATNIETINVGKENKFFKTSFNNCYFGRLYGDGNEFYNSVFSNATFESNSYRKDYLDFLFTKKDFKDTKIESCLFKNINVKNGYVINLDCNEKVKYELFELKNCIFENCESENSSFISLEGAYWSRFSRNIKTVILGSERDNIGLENLQNK
ncbi:hypothetical protein RJB73_09135 [Staphylococcus hominis]|uniref:hypothetical protein n=1 Tax=Staphylococcus hominis TaxID=1290 RepID=UPI002879B030|nr:hypothetical protein [Staphylococcus hominis]MDS3909669.1 hypothetical protein [Staphylococcus hominis]